MIVITTETNRSEMGKRTWTEQDLARASELWKSRPTYISMREWERIIARELDRTLDSVKSKIQTLELEGKIQREYITASPYPIYNEPLVMEGDAVILPDLEFPFHCAEFVNRVLDLVEMWGIKQCILSGDVLHLDSLSTFSKNFVKKKEGGLTETAELELMGLANEFTPEDREKLIGKVADIGRAEETDGLSMELEVARREMRRIADQFDLIHYILGNHEGRVLKALQTTIDPDYLLRQTEAGGKFKIAAYYFSYLDTQRERFQIEHPKGAAEGTAQQLAAKYHNSVIMGHSHLLDMSWDISGQYYAIHAGHCVDESRLPYAAQRHTTRRAHKHGAVIVKTGFPYLLHDDIDWDVMRKLYA